MQVNKNNLHGDLPLLLLINKTNVSLIQLLDGVINTRLLIMDSCGSVCCTMVCLSQLRDTFGYLWYR